MKRNKILDEAQRAIERQQYDRAIRAYKALIVETPNDLKLMLKLAELYLRKKALPQALELYHKLSADYLKRGDMQRATSVYLLISKIDQHDTISRQFLLHRFLAVGARDDVIGLLWTLVKTYDSQGQVEEARRALHSVYQHFPDLRDVRYSLAERALERGEVDEASEHLSYLFDHLIDPQDEDRRVSIGERLVTIKDDCYRIKYVLYHLYLKRGAAHLAVRGLQELFKHDPSDLDVLCLLGRSLLTLGYKGKAFKALQSVLLASRNRGEFDRASEAANLILEVDPKHAIALEVVSSLRTKDSFMSSEDPHGHETSELREKNALIVPPDPGESTDVREVGELTKEGIESPRYTTERHLGRDESLRRAHDHLLAGRPEEAFELIRVILELDATDRSALELLKDTAKALGHAQLLRSVNEAIDELDGVSQQDELDQDEPDGVNQQDDSQLEQKSEVEARDLERGALEDYLERALDEEVTESPENSEIQLNLFEESSVVPEESSVVSEEPSVVPEELSVVPEELSVVPEEPSIVPEEPIIVPEEPIIVPEEPIIVPEEPINFGHLASATLKVKSDEHDGLDAEACHPRELELEGEGVENPKGLEVDPNDSYKVEEQALTFDRDQADKRSVYSDEGAISIGEEMAEQQVTDQDLSLTSESADGLSDRASLMNLSSGSTQSFGSEDNLYSVQVMEGEGRREFAVIPLADEFDDDEGPALFTDEELHVVEGDSSFQDGELPSERVVVGSSLDPQEASSLVIEGRDSDSPNPFTLEADDKQGVTLNPPVQLSEVSLNDRLALINRQRADYLPLADPPMAELKVDPIKGLPISAREKALAEDSLSVQRVGPPSFTPAPISLNRAGLFSGERPHSRKRDQTERGESATVGELLNSNNQGHSSGRPLHSPQGLGMSSFTPSPLNLSQRESTPPLFSKPKEAIEIDRSKHEFGQLIESVDLPSPLSLNTESLSHQKGVQPSGEESVSTSIQSASYSSSFKDISPPQHEVLLLDDLNLGYDELARELMIDDQAPLITDDLSLQAVELNFDVEGGLLGESESLSFDVEEAFVALLTPLPTSNEDLTSGALHHGTHSDTYSPVIEDVFDLKWRPISLLGEGEQRSELIEFVEMCVETDQIELALSQIEVASSNREIEPNMYLYLKGVCLLRSERYSSSLEVFSHLLSRIQVTLPHKVAIDLFSKLYYLCHHEGIYQRSDQYLSELTKIDSSLAHQVIALVTKGDS